MYLSKKGDFAGKMVNSLWHHLTGIQTMAIVTAGVRSKAALNQFKREILGNGHIPGNSQKAEFFEKVNANIVPKGIRNQTKVKFGIPTRTWASWFDEQPRVPKQVKLKEIDKVMEARRTSNDPRNSSAHSFGENHFSSLVYDGLLRQMLAAPRPKYPLLTFQERAAEYTPNSALHLHFDALDACAVDKDCCGVPWHSIKAIAAERILCLLDERWCRRSGTLYKTFSSDLRLQWIAASSVEQNEIRANCARFKPDLFDHLMRSGAWPDWDLANIENDACTTHIYKSLFALGADGDFLRGDRFDAWYLDFATAGLALLAHAWSDRYQTFGASFSAERLFFTAFDSLLFSDADWRIIQGPVTAAMVECGADWSQTNASLLSAARASYQTEMTQLGIPVENIRENALATCITHGLAYEG